MQQQRIERLSQAESSLRCTMTAEGRRSRLKCSSVDGSRQHRLNNQRKQGRAMCTMRLVFLKLLAVVAITLGLGAFFVISKTEQELGDTQYEAMISRVVGLAVELVARRRVAIKSLAKIAASAFPTSALWPMVTIPAFEEISQELIATSGSYEFSFHPKVIPHSISPGEQAAFEKFAYNYFYNVRNPPFPPGTAVHSFGRGIWKTLEDGRMPQVTSSMRVHDTDGNTTSWRSPNKLLFPELQNSNAGVQGRLFLLHNVHSDSSKGRPIDQVIACTERRRTRNNSTIDCGAVSNIFSWNRLSFLVQPIHPAKDLLDVGIFISFMLSYPGISSLFLRIVRSLLG